MARISNKDKALAYAAEHGIILTVEDNTLTMTNHQDHYQNHNEAEVWVCGCCARKVNTGDESGCRDFHGHTHPTCDKNIVRADIEHTFEVGYFHANCNGCGEIVRTGGTLYAATRLINN